MTTKKRSATMDRLIGQNIRQARQKLGMTQADLAQKLGISFQQLQKYENGVDRVSAARLFEVARHTGYSLQYFYGESGPLSAQDQLALRQAEETYDLYDDLLDHLPEPERWALLTLMMSLRETHQQGSPCPQAA
ncbi:helix-turn-helix domain-containing protein [Parvularcula marina]|uniref:helix-turn-helix domain-containing protein n=1 Tax=Parvularcula marina TaxID=2292771 RepID=UPI0035111853